MSLSDELRAELTGRGIDLVGFTSAAPFVVGDEGRVADPRAVLPEARSIVIGAIYLHGFETCEAAAPGVPRAAFGQWTRASRVAEEYGKRVLGGAGAEGGRLLATTRTARAHRAEIARGMALKLIAVRSGMALCGKNCIVHAREFGSFLKLAAVVTDAALDCVDGPVDASDCGSCRACLKACPTGALDRPYHLDRARCVCEWLWGRPMPRALREKAGVQIFRCGYCQAACPKNRKLPGRTAYPFELEERSDRPELIPLLEAGDEAMRALLPAFVYNGAGPTMIRRNVAVALGNAGDRAAVPALARALCHEPPEVRSAAAWALGRLGGGPAVQALEGALSAERDETVLDEIRCALGSGPTR